MVKKSRSIDGSTPLRVRRGRVESVDLYEIKDNELDQLEQGTPAGLQLNFSIFLLSIAFGAISSLFTATFSNKTIETIYIVISVVGVLAGIYLLIAWRRTKSPVRELCRRIRERIPPEVQLPIDDDHDSAASVEEDDPDGALSLKD